MSGEIRSALGRRYDVLMILFLHIFTSTMREEASPLFLWEWHPRDLPDLSYRAENRDTL